MVIHAELFEQFRQPAVVAVCGDETETAVDFETFRVDDAQFVVCEFVQNGLDGDEGEGSRIVQVAFDAFAAAELHLDVHGLQLQTATGEGFREDVQRPGTVFPDDEREATERCHIHLVVAESRIRYGGYQHQFVVHEGFVVQGVARGFSLYHADVDTSSGDEFLYLLGVAVGQFHVDFRITSPERSEDARQEVLGDGGTRAYPDVAGRSAGIVRERVVQVGVDVEDAVRIVEHQFAVSGEGDVSPASVEQGDTQLFFQFADVFGDGRLRNEQLGGGFGETQPVGDRLEYFQSEIGYHLICNSCGGGVCGVACGGAEFPFRLAGTETNITMQLSLYAPNIRF